MIRLIKNIFGKNKKEAVSLREKPNNEVLEPKNQPEPIIQESVIVELTKEEIIKPKITELSQGEINYFIEKEARIQFWFLSGDVVFFDKLYPVEEIGKYPFKDIAITLVNSQKMYMLTHYIEADFKVNDFEVKNEIKEKLYRFGIIDNKTIRIIKDETRLNKLFLFYEKYYNDCRDRINQKVEQKKEENKVWADELEKSRIKQEYKEKERKRKLKEQALKELVEEGVLPQKIVLETSDRHISQEVKDLVWNRDNGRCVQCGSNEKLEFDHIIPFSKGGANTYRNIQLLCEKCNREKSNKIG